MMKTRKKRYRAPAALLCLCMAFSTLGSALSLPAAAQAAGAATAETAQATPEPTPEATPEAEQTEPEPTPEQTPEAEKATPEAAQPTPETAPSTAETAPATPETAPSPPETAPSTPESSLATPESAGEDAGQPESTPETAAYKAVQGPRQALPVAQNAVYVPQAPEGAPGAAACEDIEQAIAQLPDGGTLWLTGNMQIDTVTVGDGKALTIQSYGGKAFTLGKTGGGENMLALSGGAALTLENVVLDAAANTAGRTAIAESGAKLTLGPGAVLQNNTVHGAVFLDGASLIVNGGTIQNNKAAGDGGTKTYAAAGTWKNDSTRYVYEAGRGSKQGLGGAVLMVNGAKLTVSDGTLYNNTALCGGAVYAYGAGDIVLNGGTFRENKAETEADTPAAGGALCVDGGGTNRVTVGGAAFTGNSAKQGGAVYFGIDAGKVDFTVTSGTFSGNKASGNGSVLYSEAADCVTDISGANTVFSGNEAGGSGGIYLERYPQGERSARAAVNIHGGVQFENNRAQRGSCLYMTENDAVQTCTVDGAVFTGNEASAWGGALYCRLNGAQIELKNSTFQNNQAKGGAGGVLYHTVGENDEYTIKDCTFEGNKSDLKYGEGGGFCLKGKGIDLTVAGGRFTGNTAWDNGGAFSVYLDGGSVTVDGTEFSSNVSGSSGGAFIAFINKADVTVTGGAQFTRNTADVNAGAFSVRRYNKDSRGTVRLLACDIVENVCNADFKNYDAADLEPTRHYNTGGVYIGENITCHMYDALVTGNYVESGYTGGTVGSGIGLCPNAQVYLLPEHGATVYNNGPADTMDILAVPYDYPVITHETPAKLYISAVTPAGQACNWTDLDHAKARTGQYDWTNARSGAAAVSAAGIYAGEKDLAPAGFRANIGGAGARTAAPVAADGYKVRIVNNHTRSALYAGGGVMVNGTVIVGEFSVSVQKTVTVNGATDAQKSALQTQQPFRFRFSIVDTGAEAGSSGLKAPAEPVGYSTEKGKSGSVTFTKGTTALTGGQDGYSGPGGTFASLSGEFTIQGEDTLTFGQIKGNEIGINTEDDSGRYFFLLEEIGNGGAAQTVITPPANTGASGLDGLVFAFTCANTFDFGTLELNKTVSGTMGEKDRLWTFDIDIRTATYGTPLSGTFPAELLVNGEAADFTGEQGGLTFTGGKTQVSFDTEGRATVQLTDGQTLKIYDLPAGTTYTVSEREADQYGYTTTPADESGSIQKETAATPQFTNDRETAPRGRLMVFKTVTGNGDRTKEFAFSVEFTPASLLTDAEILKNGLPASDLTIEDGKLTFTLKDGENLTVGNLPVGTAYTVTEAEVGGYTTTVTDNDGEDDGKGIIVANREGQVRFVNDLPPTPAPTPTPCPKPTPTPTPRPTPSPCPTPTPCRTPGPGGPGGGPGHVPPTGDNSPLGLWTVLLLAALLGLTAVGIAYWKKKQ